MPGAHQIAADVLTRTDQITKRLFLDVRNPDRVQAVDHQQSHQPLSVAAIGLDLVLRRALDLPRCRDHTPNPAPPAAHGQARTPSAQPHTRRAPVPAAPHRTQPPQPSPRTDGAQSSLPTRRRPRTPPPSRHARRGRPRCEPWSRSAPPYAVVGAARGATRTATNHPTNASRGNRPISTCQAGRQPPYGLTSSGSLLAIGAVLVFAGPGSLHHRGDLRDGGWRRPRARTPKRSHGW